MLTVRCDSCGEALLEAYYDCQMWPSDQGWVKEFKSPLPPPSDFLTGQVCVLCAQQFLSGKMHAEATTDHV